MTYVGAGVRRVEDADLVRGQGKYVGDIQRDGLLAVGFVRGPHAHARIRRIDLAAARALHGVRAAFAAEDLPEVAGAVPPTVMPPMLKAKGYSPLAHGTVRYVGEAVAVVVAADEYVLADALEAVEVEYDPMPATVGMETAIEGGPLVWPDVENNVALDLTLGFGDVDAVFGDAPVVVEGRYVFARSAGASMEPRGVLAAPGGENGVRLTVWDSTQAPHNVRAALAGYLGLEVHEVRVVTPDVGGGFGPKGRIYAEEYIVAALALRLGVPVRWLSTRSEDLQTTSQGRGQIHEVQLAARADGTILAMRNHIMQDAGAYTASGLVAPLNTLRHCLGPYRVPAAQIHVTGIYTNTVPTCPLRGGGRAEGIFMVERTLDRLAARLGVDRAEVRRRNLLPPEAFPHDTGLPSGGPHTVTYDSGQFPLYLERALETSGYQDFPSRQAQARERGRYLGLGLAAFIESTGVGVEGASVDIAEDGTVSVAVGSPSNGQGHATTMAQMAAERLGVKLDTVLFRSGDTALPPAGTGTFGSRMGQYGGNAVSLAALAAREQVLALASRLLEIAPGDLEIVEGRVRVRGLPERGLSLGEIAADASERGEELGARRIFQPERQSTWAGGVTVVMVEVDVDTGKVRVLRSVVIHDAGTIVNPMIVDGQVHGGVLHGLGNALYEESPFSPEGQPLVTTFAEYDLPGVGETPVIEVRHVETPSPFNAEGIKGCGEGGTIAALPAIVSAVEDALAPFGVTVHSVPMRSGDIVAWIAQAQGRA